MSKLIETYALNCGVPIDEPSVVEAVYPLSHPLDKTILIHAFSGAVNNNNATFPAKIYDHFSEVIALLKPIVEPLGYKIFQIGAVGEPGLPGIEYLCGQTSMNQCAYLVKRCVLLIGNDSMWAHMRGAFRGALVAVYGPTDVKNHGPYWNEPRKTILIESHRRGKKPSYATNEYPKTVDMVLPEEIVNGALQLLQQPFSINHESFFFGAAYHAQVVEIVPNITVSPNIQLAGTVVIRMDYHFDEKNLAQNLSLRSCSIMTNKEFNLGILAQFKQNVVSLRVEVDNVSPEWVRKAQRLGIPMGIFALEKDPKKVVELRMKYGDTLFDLFVPPTKEEFVKQAEEYRNKKLDTELKFDKLKFKTNKFLLSNGKIYLSKAHMKADIVAKSTSDNIDTVIDNEDFWTEQQHFYFFQ